MGMRAARGPVARVRGAVVGVAAEQGSIVVRGSVAVVVHAVTDLCTRWDAARFGLCVFIRGIAGVAPGANLVALDIFGAEDAGYNSSFIQAGYGLCDARTPSRVLRYVPK